MRSNRKYKHYQAQVLGRRKNEKGFTIVEVLMAISIFAIGLLAVATMQISAIKVNSSANHQTIRTTYAMDRLEQIMAWDYGHALLVDNDPNVGAPTTHNTGIQTFGYTVSWTVDDNNPIQGAKRIIVTVTEGGGLKTTQLQTIKSDT